MTPLEERRKRLEQALVAFDAGDSLERVISLLEREIDAAVGQRDLQFHEAACREFEGIQPMEALRRVFGKEIPTAIIHETVKRDWTGERGTVIRAAVGQATVFNLCESGFVIPRPGQLYTYRVAPGCPKCEELAVPYVAQEAEAIRSRSESPAAKEQHATNCMWMMTRIEPCDCGAAAHPKAGEEEKP